MAVGSHEKEGLKISSWVNDRAGAGGGNTFRGGQTDGGRKGRRKG